MPHTPGPWICYADLPSTEPNWHIVTTANKMRVLANVHIEPGNIVDEANARLIAAAPDMLAVCRKALEFIREEAENRAEAGSEYSDYEREPRQLVEELEAAIAKAEG